GINTINGAGLEFLLTGELLAVLLLFYRPFRGRKTVPIRLVALIEGLVKWCQCQTLVGQAIGDAEKVRRALKRVGLARDRFKARQQLARLRHNRGKRFARIDLGTQHQRTVHEGKTIRVILETLGAKAEGHGDLDEVARFPGARQDRVTARLT